ncbi:sce7726 family protein [Sphingobium sp. TomTYG75]
MGQILRDIDVRRAAYGRLLSHARRCPDTRVIDELGVGHGANRIDIAVINGHFRGMEIKSDADNIKRLPGQISAYGEVVDRASLIVAPRHLASALEVLPNWWGVVLADRGVTGGVIFKRLRDERANPMVNPMSLARLLWHDEVAAILRERGHPERLLRSPRAILYATLVSELQPRAVATLVRETLKARKGWRGH